MKIAFVFEIFFPTVNGVITSTLNLAQNLTEMGHEVLLIAPRWKEYRESSVDGLPVRYITSAANWAYPGMRTVLPWNRTVAGVLKRERVDILHVTGPWLLTWAAIRAARRFGIPVVHTFHTMLHEPSYIVYMFRLPLLVPLIQAIAWSYYGLYIRRCDVNTGPSRMVCGHLERHFPDADVRFISNGVDVQRFDTYASLTDLRERYPEHNDQTFLFVGRLGEEKSVHELIEAMEIVAQGNDQVRLFIAGDGPARRFYTTEIHRLRLANRVFLLGRIGHAELLASGLIHHALAFVTASTTENQPMTVIEAICCGIPAIVPDVPGITELVEENGLRFPAHDPAALARTMIRIAEDRELRDGCARESRTMKERFDGRNVALEFESIYRFLRDNR